MIAGVMVVPGCGTSSQNGTRSRREKGEGDAAGLAKGDDPPPVKIEQLVQLHQIAGDGNERCSNDTTVYQIQ